MEITEQPSEKYKSYNELLHSSYSEKYIASGIQKSLTRNNHMNEYDGEPCEKAARAVITDLIDSAIFPAVSHKLSVIDLLTKLTETARVVRRAAYDLKETTVDAILVDFINYVGVCNCVDYALYTKDFKPKVDRSKDDRTVPASNFCEMLEANVENKKLTDKEFRQFVKNTLPIVVF